MSDLINFRFGKMSYLWILNIRTLTENLEVFVVVAVVFGVCWQGHCWLVGFSFSWIFVVGLAFDIYMLCKVSPSTGVTALKTSCFFKFWPSLNLFVASSIGDDAARSCVFADWCCDDSRAI